MINYVIKIYDILKLCVFNGDLN